MIRPRAITAALADSDSIGWWILSVPVVSLDCIRPYWDAMGLRFEHPDRVLAALRTFAIAEEALPGNPNTKTYGRKVLTLTRALFRDLIEAEGNPEQGEQAVFTLWNWFRLGCDEEPKWHWMWRILMYQLPGVVPGPVGLPKVKARTLARVAESFADAVRDIETRVELIQSRPHTRWDAARYLYLQRDGSEWDPLGTLSEAMDRIEFDRRWAEVVATFTLREMDLLVRWGLEHAADLEAGKDDAGRKNDAILGHRALQVRDARIPSELRLFQ